MRRGLTNRMIMASGLLALIMGATFAVLLVAINQSRESRNHERHADEVLLATNHVERLVLDLETGQRGFVLTGQLSFLEPWDAAQAALPGAIDNLQHLVVGTSEADAATAIADKVMSYIRDYSIPLVDAARRQDPSAASVTATAEGKRRVDDLRAEFDGLLATERSSVDASQSRSDASIRRAIAAAVGGLVGSTVLIVLFGTYLTRSIVVPLRRSATMADRLAGGDLGARMTASGPAEIGVLERSFNVMADSLQKDRADLARLAAEQAALRRVATLVARAAPPDDVFAAVAEESGQLVGVDSTMLNRYEDDGTVTVIAGWDRTGAHVRLGSSFVLGGNDLRGLVARSGRPARTSNDADGARPGVGTPIFVAGRLWGVITAQSSSEQPLPADTEVRLADFTDLVGAAVANAEGRTQLAASRARVVAAADETRRRIERDLHDGTQQRLVSLGLELRSVQATVPADLTDVKAQLSHAATGLAEVVDDLQEISRGIHPAILSKGGLAAAIRALGRRSGLPVELDLRIDRRLAPGIEVAAYYIVSEALTNAAKHAHASAVFVEISAEDSNLELAIRDDGIGGADPGHGSGLIGLSDRVEALGGTLELSSSFGTGTALLVSIPIESDVVGQSDDSEDR